MAPDAALLEGTEAPIMAAGGPLAQHRINIGRVLQQPAGNQTATMQPHVPP